MAAIGMAELIVLLFLGQGTSPELLSMIDANDYFTARGIKAESAEQLIALAGNAAKAPKESVARLLAIRSLGERKEAGARATLTKIAAEPAGFARDYAERALAAIDGKAAPAAAMPKGSVTDDGLSMFPADVDFFAALDRRGFGSPTSGVDEKQIAALRKALPEEMKEIVYQFADSVGNIRVDRVSWAYSEEPKDRRGRIMIRLTGQADHKALAQFMAAAMPGANIREDKAAGTLAVSGNRMPEFLFLGDGELVIAGFGNKGDNHAELLQQMFEVKAGKRPGVVKGAFSKDLKGMGPEVFALFMGALPESLRKELARSPLGAAPQNVIVDWAKTDAGMRMRLRAEADDADQAKQLANGASVLREQALEGLKNAPNEVPAELVKNARALLESLKIGSAGKIATVEAAVSAEFLQTGPQMMMQLLLMKGGRVGVGAGSAPPRAVEAPRAVPAPKAP